LLVRLIANRLNQIINYHYLIVRRTPNIENTDVCLYVCMYVCAKRYH
jgi:hypothetical protein